MEVRELIEFEEEIKDLFEAAKIRAPIHLVGANESTIIEIFKDVKEDDWVFSSHRNHLHALLKGIPKEVLKSKILNGNSMHTASKEHNFMCSSIVGGCLPIALGVAFGIKRYGLKNHVWIFVGDMASEMGVFHECTKYAARNDLPITFVVEDNGFSTDTPTQECWGESDSEPDIIRYKYERKYPHTGSGTFVRF